MSGVALDVSPRPTSEWFVPLLKRVVLGYLSAAVTLAALYLLLYRLGFPPGPPLRPGPFPASGAWSLAADLIPGAMIVLVAAGWIRVLIADAVKAPVSFGVVALAVAATFYIPFLALRPALISVVLTLPVTTWIVQRYAIGTTLPLPKPTRSVWIVLAVAALLVFGSYRAYHPLISLGSEGDGSTEVDNPGWAGVTITHVDGGYIGSWGSHHKLPYTVGAHSRVVVWSTGPSCNDVVKLTFSVLGRTATQSFVVSDEQSIACGGF